MLIFFPQNWLLFCKQGCLPTEYTAEFEGSQAAHFGFIFMFLFTKILNSECLFQIICQSPSMSLHRAY
jgi:hypothetical protein